MKAGTATEVADVYARSLLEAAKESGTVDLVAADLEVVATLMMQQPELGTFLASPYVAEQPKRDLIRKVLTGTLHPITVHFLGVVLGHNRGALVSTILERYRQRYRTYQGYETVHVTVAQHLSQEQTEKLSRDLAGAMQAKIDLEVRVDPAILGGVIIRRGDRMLDNSIRGRLETIVDRIAGPERRNKQKLDEG